MKERVKQPLQLKIDNISIFVISIVLAYYFLLNTMFQIPWPDKISLHLRLALLLVAILRLTNCRRMPWNISLFMLAFIFIFYETYIHDTSHSHIVNIILLVIAAYDIPIKKIAKGYFITILSLLFITITCSLIGIIPNLSYVSENSNRVRYCLGTTHYFFVTASLFYMVCAYIIIRQEKIRYIELLIIEIINIFSYIFCNSRNHLICITVIVIAMTLIKLTYSTKDKESTPRTILHIALCFSPILSAIGSIVAILSFPYMSYSNSPLLLTLNSAVSNRLTLGKRGYIVYGFSILGQKIDTYFHQRVTSVDLDHNAFVIDSGYIYLAIKYGILVLGIFLCILFWMNCRAYEDKNWILLFIFSMNAFQFIIDRDMFYINCNFMLWCTFSNISKNGRNALPKQKELVPPPVVPRQQ